MLKITAFDCFFVVMIIVCRCHCNVAGIRVLNCVLYSLVLTVPAMWHDFNEHAEQPISYKLYRQVFAGENIAFGQPSRDDCDACITYKCHSNEKLENHPHDCELCEQSRQHE